MRKTILFTLMILMLSCQKEVTKSSAVSAATTDNTVTTSTYRQIYPVEYWDYNGCAQQDIYIQGTITFLIHETTIPGNKRNIVVELYSNDLTVTELGTGIVKPLIIHETDASTATWDTERNTWVLSTENLIINTIYMSSQGASLDYKDAFHIIALPDGTIKIDTERYSITCK